MYTYSCLLSDKVENLSLEEPAPSTSNLEGKTTGGTEKGEGATKKKRNWKEFRAQVKAKVATRKALEKEALAKGEQPPPTPPRKRTKRGAPTTPTSGASNESQGRMKKSKTGDNTMLFVSHKGGSTPSSTRSRPSNGNAESRKPDTRRRGSSIASASQPSRQ